MFFDDYNFMILTKVKMEMMRTAALLSSDERVLLDLSELIDSFTESFVVTHELVRLAEDKTSEYARMLFQDVADGLTPYVENVWRSMSLPKKAMMYFPFIFAKVRLTKVVRIARVALY